VSNFGDLVKRLRKEKGMTLEQVAKKIGSHKGYVSGIENDKVNPPSVKIIRKFAKVFSQDERQLVRIAWADKAPAIIREDAQRVMTLADQEGDGSADLARVSLLNTVTSGYPADVGSDGKVRAAVSASLVLPKGRISVDAAVTVVDDSMVQQGSGGFNRSDVVLLVRDEKIRNGAVAFVVFSLRGKRQALLRQVMVEQGDNIVLQPLNKEYPLEFLAHDDMDAVYRVVGKIEMFDSALVEMKG
jgi:transcriptional regulator with XRE-family HTH domain